MADMDSNSEFSSCSCDTFDDNAVNERYKYLMSRNGNPLTHLPAVTAQAYDTFKNRGNTYIGELKKRILKADSPFNLKYNTIDYILFEKAKTKLN